MPKCKHCRVEFNGKFCKEIDCQTQKALTNLAKIKQLRKKEIDNVHNQLKPSVYAKEYKASLQSEINKLARSIDTYFNLPCIDCGKFYGKQSDGAHFNNVQGHENIRFNLHNIHKSRSDCNQYSSQHKTGYRIGLENRYGIDYLNLVDFGLNLEYKELHLTPQDIFDKLKIVRKLNRDFDTFTFETPIQARELLNKLIGIYK